MTTLSLITALSLMIPYTDAVSSPSLVIVGPADGPRPSRRVSVQVDGKALLEQQVADAAEQTTYFVRTDGTKALSEAHGVDVVDDPAAPAIVVHLSWIDYSESIYSVRIETVHPGKAPQLLETFQCECADSDLTAAVIARFPAALEQLDTRDSKPEDGSAKAVPAEPTPKRADDVVDDEPRKPLGPLGRAGIGVGVAGVGALVGGGILYSRGERFDPPSGVLEERDGRNFQPPGIALMVTGGAALVTGAVLLIVDRNKARRSASALVLPSPHGLVLTGRF